MKEGVKNCWPFWPNPDLALRYLHPVAKGLTKAFLAATDSRWLCHEICDQNFASLDEHSAFMEQGGCEQLISILAEAGKAAAG